jgi:hypothetical protein
LHRLAHLAGASGRDFLAGAGRGVVVDDDDLVNDAGGVEFLDGATDGIPLVVGRQDE